MYCLEKLQRELAYFFDMDLSALPRVQDLLAAQGYTQVQKGDEIIKLERAQAESTLSAKTTSKLTKEQLEALPLATPQEYGEFLEKIAQKDYQNTPEILKIATLNNDLQELINNNHSANVFITRARAGHISEARKGEYDQALTLEEQKQIPAVIAQAKQAYTDDKSGFILPFADKNNSEKINLIILDSDSKGNFLITAKKVNSAELDNPKYKKLARAGVEPATTTPPKAEQKPTEAISLARDEIIPQTEISNIKKQLVELKESKSAYQKVLKSLERNMKDVELEERRYLRGEERIKVFERKRLIQSSIDEHTQGLNAVLKKMIDLHKQLPENVRYTKEVLDDLTKIEAILKGNDYSLEQALTLSKITQRLQEKAIIESESFLNKVYNLDDFAKGAKSLQGTSYAYNTDESIKRYFKTIAEMIDSIPAFKISANQLTTPQETLPAGVKTRVNNLMTKINDLYNAASIISHDKLQAQIKSIKDPQVLRAFLQRLDETYTEPKGFIKLSRDLAQKNLEAYSDPQVQEILAVLGGASKPRDKTKVRELYHRYGTPELKGLFDKVLDIVGDIPFEIKKIPTKLGNYNLTHHTIALDEKLLLDKNIDRFMQTLLHELIHSTIARAQYHLLSPKNYPDLASKLTPAQKAAVKEIDDLYILAFKTHQAQKRAKTLGDDEQRFYGFTNSKEFVAELANPKFRSYLEKQNIFKRVLNAIIKFFTGGEGEQTTILKALQESYEKYLDSFGESSESFFAKATQTTHAQKSDDLVLFDRDSSAPNFTYTTGEAKGIAELRKDLKQALEPYKSTPITNKETGLQGVVTDTERNKISSKKAVDKSIANGFTRDEHFAAAQDLKNLFENATKAQSHNDYKQRENIAQVHRFVKDLYINDKQAQAKITLFEKIEGKNRIYTLELESLSPTPQSSPHTQAGVAVEAQVTRDVVRPNANIAKTDGESIAQDSNALLESTMKSFKYDEKKAKDLLEWHKDSHPLTKDENGVPKVFYHGTSSDKVFEVFNKDKIHSGYGFWFGDDIADRAVKENTTGKAPIIKAFLQMKKPFIFSNQGITAQNIDEYAYITGISKKRITELYEAKEAFNTLEKMIQRDTQADYVWAGAVDYFEIEKGGKELNIFDYRQLDLSDQTIAFLDRMRTKGITARGIDISPTRQYESAQEARETLERLKEKGYDSMVYANSEFVVFDSNQIKHIENRGIESEQGRKYFNESSPNIFHSNPHAGAGLLGGSVAGVEQDENGNITFSPEKFALGFLGGAAGSKAVAKGLEWRANKVAKSYPNIAKDNPTLMQEIAKRDLQTYAMTNTHNALTRFLNNNKLLDVNPKLFAGEKALVNEAYAPHKARLERAKELESSGADEIEIWEKTGWYKDKDQRWKFEISQSGGELYTKDEYGRPYKREFLHKILKDDELFNAYPKLRDLRVIEDKKLGRGVSASYDPKLKDIYIKNLQAKEAKISLYHEIQHAIQDIEGFAYGFKDYVTSDENFHKYAIQHGEVEARNVESRMKLPTKRDVQNLKRFAKDRDKNIEFLKTSDYEEWYKNKRIKESQSEKKHFLAAAQTAQEIINKGKYTDHPHKTMDKPLKDTIAESTMQGEALSKKLGDKAGDTLKSTQKVQGESKEMQQQLQSTIQTHLENLPPNPTPQPINEAKIKALIKRFDNIENLQEHLNTRADTKARQEIFSLLDDTLQTPQVHYKKDGKDKYLKRYKSERKEPYFYLLVTKDENKTFITHFKTRDSKYLSKEITKAQEIIQGADIIEALSQRTGDI